MFFIPGWISNILFMITIYISGYQHVRMKYRNSVKNLQFFIVFLSLVMIVLSALYSRESPWLSLAFFVVAVVDLVVILRQRRFMPPSRFM